MRWSFPSWPNYAYKIVVLVWIPLGNIPRDVNFSVSTLFGGWSQGALSRKRVMKDKNLSSRLGHLELIPLGTRRHAGTCFKITPTKRCQDPRYSNSRTFPYAASFVVAASRGTDSPVPLACPVSWLSMLPQLEEAFRHSRRYAEQPQHKEVHAKSTGSICHSEDLNT